MVILNHATNASLRTELSVQEGPLQLDGGLTRVANVYVYNTATLSGQGTIGEASAHYTPVRVLDGGTLDASNHLTKALTIVGTLRLDKEATYKMTILDNTNAALHVTKDPLVVTPVVNLSGDLSLTLASGYTHVANSWIHLLTTDGLIDGEFLTVNNQYFSGSSGDEFMLGGYEFRIVYDHDLGGDVTAVALQAMTIPESETVALLIGMTLAGVVWARRRVRA